MVLYHYTKLVNFESIWNSMSIWFSEYKQSNDYFERHKFIVCNTNLSNPKIMLNRIYNEIRMYKQISFCKDYEDGTKGYASPMMWGQYARSKKSEEWQDGVCLELDSTKFKTKSGFFFYNAIKYSPQIVPQNMGDFDFTQNDVITKFIDTNKNLLFFTKHKHWEHENEYRFISKDCKEIDISDAITGVYVLDKDSATMEKVEKFVHNSTNVYFVTIGGLNGLSRCDYRHFISMKKNE